MKALRFANGNLAVHDVARPLWDGEALVRVTLSGICNTDLEIVKGYAGFEGTIGHEFVGVLEESDDAPELMGKRVVGEINAGCGECSRCLTGDPRHCPRRSVLGIVKRDGAHAEYLRLPSSNLLPVPEGVTDEEAVFTEPLAAAVGITEQVGIFADTSVAVVGDGKLGLLAAMALRQTSERVTLIGKHREKMDLVADLGVDHAMVSAIPSSLLSSFDVVVEASGSESGFSTALDLTRPRGKLVLKSTFHGAAAWSAAKVVVDEITIVGSRCGRFAPALEMLASGNVPVARLVHATYPLSSGVEAMAAARQPGTLKILLAASK